MTMKTKEKGEGGDTNFKEKKMKNENIFFRR
jgi:hypothetical protein